MALNEKRRELLKKILDHVEDKGDFPDKWQFRATVDPDDWDDGLSQLVSSHFLYEERFERLRYLPSFAALGWMREHHEFAASEIKRARRILPVLQREYRDGLFEKQRSVAELANELECADDELRRTVRTMHKVRSILGTALPPGKSAFETFTLTEDVLRLKSEDLDPPPDPDAVSDEDEADLEAIWQNRTMVLGPEAPPEGAMADARGAKDRTSAYDSRGFHPAVVSSSRPLFLDGEGHPREALERATRAALDEVKKRSGRNHLDGEDLVNIVFSEKSPILVLPDRTTKSGESEQRGAFHLARAIVALLRNPNAHELRDHADEYALECLGMVSLFYRYLDRMTLAPVQAAAGGAAPAEQVPKERKAPSAVGGPPKPDLALTLDYRKVQDTGKVHGYELQVMLTNKDTRRFDDWYIEVEFPTRLLAPGTVIGGHVPRPSDAGSRTRIYRTTIGNATAGPGRKPLAAGDEFPWKLSYVMNEEIRREDRDEGGAVLDASVAARVFVNGELVKEVKKLARDMQCF